MRRAVRVLNGVGVHGHVRTAAPRRMCLELAMHFAHSAAKLPVSSHSVCLVTRSYERSSWHYD